MATRSTIALEYADGTVGQVYCHWDGYLDNNGKILLMHYSDPFVLRDLLDLGDISSLGRVVGAEHPFSPHTSPEDKAAHDAAAAAGYTTFYGRDRGETGVAQKMFASYEDYVENHQHEEYEYILRRDGIWYVKCYSNAYVPLGEAIAAELQEKHEEALM
jgi:hypothetical protein